MTNQEVIAQALEQIYHSTGELTPVAVVRAASVPDHPLHSQFEWDDREAAVQHRLSQARNLIRSVQVRFMTAEEEGVIRQWHAARRVGSERPGYLPDNEVHDDPVMSAALLRSMEREWLNMRRRWKHQQAFWEMVVVDIPDQTETG